MADQTRHSSTAKNAAVPAGPYYGRLDPDDQEIYRIATGDVDLTEEIRLMRVVISRLVMDMMTNKQAISSLFGAVVRAVAFQAGRSSDLADLERALQEATGLALDRVGAPGAGDDEEEEE